MPTFSSSVLLSCFFLFLFLIPVAISLNFAVNSSTNLKNMNKAKNVDVSHSGDSYEIASNVDPQNSPDTENIGRATYHKKMHLWDKRSKKLANFSTYFKFEIYSPLGGNNEETGDGLAFFIAPARSKIPDAYVNGSFGLVNSLDDESSFVAVEFDTYNNDWEKNLSCPHVGININSVKSNITTGWSNNIFVERDTEAWISYNSGTMTFSVNFTGYPGDESNNTVVYGNLSFVVDLTKYLPEDVIVGFSASTVKRGQEIHKVYNWNFTSTKIADTEKERIALILRLTVGLMSLLVLVLALVLSFHLWKKCHEKASAKAAAAAS